MEDLEIKYTKENKCIKIEELGVCFTSYKHFSSFVLHQLFSLF